MYGNTGNGNNNNQGYAPIPYSYTPEIITSTNLNENIKLYNNSNERDLYETLAEIYSIIITLDGLERAYLKDCISETEYTETCNRLLVQYKSNLNDENVAKVFINLDAFINQWNV